MKFIQASLLSALVSNVGATTLIALAPPTIELGSDYLVEWLTTDTSKLQLLLVRDDGDGWESVKTLFEGVPATPCGGNYTWAVGNSYSLDDKYGLWISSNSYSDLTSWFKFTKKKA